MSGVDFRCVACGRRAPGTAAACPACDACLLVDVVVEHAVGDARAVYLVAREVDRLGGRAPSFELVRDALSRPSGVVAAEATRALAQVVVGILRQHDIPAVVVPLRRPRARLAAVLPAARLRLALRRLPTSAKIVAAAVVALVGLVAGLALRAAEREAASRPPVAQAAGPTLPSRDLVVAALRSSVWVCSPVAAAVGFFVAPELVVTAAAGLPPGNPAVEVVLHDGRTLPGRVERRDDWLDLALVALAEPAGLPLPLGDATLLEPGQQVVAVNAAAGADLAAAQGIVSHPARLLLGSCLVQVDAGGRGGPGGGPVVDGRGQVVALSSASLAGAALPGLVTPVNALYAAGADGSRPLLERERDPAERARWTALATRAAEQEAADLEAARTALGRPTLVAAVLAAPGVVRAVVARTAAAGPSPEQLSFELAGGGRRCTLAGDASDWQPDRNAAEHSGGRHLRWLARNGLAAELYTATVALSAASCPAAELGAELRLEDGDPRADRVAITAALPAGRPW